jgi:uncharacterized damage-inducible protein DinB
MLTYGGPEMAESFRTVRRNTATIADEIPAEQYSYRPAADTRTVGDILAHVAVSPMWQIDVHGERIATVTFEIFSTRVAQAAAAEQILTTKDEILQALRDNGDRFADFLQGLTLEALAERVSFPPPVKPESRTRFEMLLGAKEHEMHHRAQLMVYQRLLGIVPHLTRARQQMISQAPARV